MDNIKIGRQTVSVTSDGQYDVSGKTVYLPRLDYSDVEVFSPKDGAEILEWDMSSTFTDKICKISVTNEDSFQAARRYVKPFVMNFANAHNPGGGFIVGANAQEEALCRCSTLYASLSSGKAKKMYTFNNTHPSRVESDYMLLSPNVCVFRNEKCELSDEPFLAAVITIPAPDRHGAAMFASKKMISDTMLRRIRIMMRIAARKGYKNLVLGAWGCGAFGNNPDDVSGYFKKVIIDEKYGMCFDEICFAVYGRTDSSNIKSFKNTFINCISEK